MSRNLILALAAVAALAAGGYFVFGPDEAPESANNDTTSSAATETVAEPAAETVAPENEDLPAILEMAIGDANAPVTIIEYASFTCPHCRNFHENVFGDIKTNFVDTGKVRFVVRDVYFDRLGLWASILARCGGPERYFGIADLIYRKQGEWTQGEDSATITANLLQLGRLAGMNDAEMNTCLQDENKAKALVAAYQENTARDGINSTPSFLINGKNYSNMRYEEFADIINALVDG